MIDVEPGHIGSGGQSPAGRAVGAVINGVGGTTNPVSRGGVRPFLRPRHPTFRSSGGTCRVALDAVRDLPKVRSDVGMGMLAGGQDGHADPEGASEPLL